MKLAIFSHVAIACTDPVRTEDFYTRHFGARRAAVFGGGPEQVVFLRMPNGAFYLELFQAKGQPPAAPADGAGPQCPGFRHLAFQVDDIDAKLAEMGADARISLGPIRFDSVIPGWRTVWIVDPDDRIVEISQGFIDQLGWIPPK